MTKINPLVRSLTAPPIPAVAAWAAEYDGSLGKLIDLAQAVPGYPPHPQLLEWLGQEAASPANAGYGPIEGQTALRNAYAAEVSRIYAAGLDAAKIHITAGCNQAFFATALAIAGSGDRILMTNPYYFNQETTLAMLGIEVGLIDCDPEAGFVPDLDQLVAALKPDVRAVALVTPNNPTGAVYPSDLLEKVYDLCRANGSWLILDETYRDFLQGEGAPHALFQRPDWKDVLIGLYSFSKSFCIPGHRLGAITAGEELVEEIAKVMDNLQICAPKPPQMAVAKAIPALADWRAENREEIDRRVVALKAAMDKLPEWHVASIGAYFAFIRHPFDGVSAELVARELARRVGVSCLPGSYFGNGLERYLRFAFANAGAETLVLLTDRLKRLEIG